jgi:hypothetical protein
VHSGIPWPRLPSGQLDLQDETFRQAARMYAAVAPLRELRSSLSAFRLGVNLSVGGGGRNRCGLRPFWTKTGRNQPSNAEYIFGPSVWIRSLVRPPEGCAIAYIDWRQQEIGIAAALSGDPAMQAAYRSGDFYLAFAQQAGAVPRDATRQTHGPERELFKTCALGVQYGMEFQSLAERIGGSPVQARDLLRAHHETYCTFWQWSDRVVDHAVLTGELHTVFGWMLHVTADFNPRSLRNHLMQANGAEMMRLAACLMTERGIEVCAPVHDAFLICAPLDRIEADVVAAHDAMREASRIVLAGFGLDTDASITGWPNRYSDPRGARMWRVVVDLIGGDVERPAIVGAAA